MEKMNLAQKLVEIQKRVRGLAKDKNAATYQYVSGSKVLNIIRPAMDELGVLLVPNITGSHFEREDYELTGANGTKKPKSEIFCTIDILFTWIDAESGEKLEVPFVSSGMNNWDKGLGSALTYGERYFLLKFFHIQTDADDVDAKIDEDNLTEVILWLGTLSTPQELENAWNTYAQYYGKNKDFIKAFTKRQKEVSNGAR